MKQTYEFNERIQNVNWSLIHIDTLLNYARENKNPSFVIYAAFESRHLLERIEFEIIVMSANSKFGLQDFEAIKKRHGINKANKKFSALKFRYQTFTEAFAKAVKPELKLNFFNFKESETLKENLSQYLHLYSRMDNELEFDSDFIQNGFIHIKATKDFLESYFTKDLNGFYFGVLDFTTINESMKSEFNNWLGASEQNNETLTKRLIEIVNNDIN